MRSDESARLGLASKRSLGFWLLVVDAVLWIGLYFAATWARTGGHRAPVDLSWTAGSVLLLLLLLVIYIIGGYSRRTDMGTLSYASVHIIAVVLTMLGAALFVYVFATFPTVVKSSRAVLFSSFVAFAPASLTYRRVLAARLRVARAAQGFLVIGIGALAKRFYESFRQSGTPQSLSFVDPQEKIAGEPIIGEDSPVIVGNLARQLDLVGRTYDGVIIAAERREVSDRLLNRLVNIHFQAGPVYTLEAFYEVFWRRVPVYSIDPMWALNQEFQLSRNSIYDHAKRVADLVLGGLLLVITSPLLLLIFILIKLERSGPALFRQERVGKDSVPFNMTKFRTMRVGSESASPYTAEGDPRITPLGKWLRQLRLDELPQLWHVIVGDMSLIGPRAEWTRCAVLYMQTIPHYHFRNLVKPGITGWAQINYPYGASEKDMIEKLKYDLYYIRHYSLVLDCEIILKTIHIVLFGKGR